MTGAVHMWGFSAKHAVFEPADGFPRELLQKNQPRPSLSEWPRPSLVEVLEGGRSFPAGDFPGTSGFMHLISPRAMDAMGDVFGLYSTLYPVDIEGQPDGWRLFQPTSVVDCLDVEASKVSRLPFQDNRIYSVDQPVFLEDVSPDSGLFVVPQCPFGHIYVCEDVKSQIKRHKLKGFVLLAKPFGKPWTS